MFPYLTSESELTMKCIATLLASVGLVAAHGYVDSATIGGKDYKVCPKTSPVLSLLCAADANIIRRCSSTRSASLPTVSPVSAKSLTHMQPYMDPYMGNNAVIMTRFSYRLFNADFATFSPRESLAPSPATAPSRTPRPSTSSATLAPCPPPSTLMPPPARP
jgi:hypothetical protein